MGDSELGRKEVSFVGGLARKENHMQGCYLILCLANYSFLCFPQRKCALKTELSRELICESAFEVSEVRKLSLNLLLSSSGVTEILMFAVL